MLGVLVCTLGFVSGCGSTDNPNPGGGPGSPDAGTGSPDAGGGLPETPACTTPSDCPLVEDCRCNSGEVFRGRSCSNGACVMRNAFCDATCSGRGGWTPNPLGCYYWRLTKSEVPGSGANYTGAQSDCQSSLKMSIDRPDNPTTYSWCVPADPICKSDADCPADWRCNEPVSGRTGTGFRFCMAPLGSKSGVFCNLK